MPKLLRITNEMLIRIWLLLLLLVLVRSAQAADVRILDLKTKDIIYDPFSQKIYASVPSSAGALGNTITVIDPSTATVGPSIFIGSEPGKLAISDDGQFLYVSLDGAAAVRRFNIPMQTAGLQFSVGSDSFFGPFFVEDMAVQPGDPGVVAISRMIQSGSPRHAGVAIYDDGIQRSGTTPGHTGSNVIEFASSAGRLYGYNNETTEFGFRRMMVDETGVSVLEATGNIISGFGSDIKFDGGLIFSTTGRVIDPEPRTIVGTFSFPTSAFSSFVAPDTAAGRVYFLRDNTLLTYDSTSLVLLDSDVIPGVVGQSGSLIRWGADGLAFRTSGDQVFLIRPSGSGPTADVLISVAESSDPVMVGNPLAYTITIINNGPTDATDVVLTEMLNIGHIPSGSSAVINVTIVPSTAGPIANSLSVSANEPDPDTSNNLASLNTTASGEVAAPDLTGSWINLKQSCPRRLACMLRGNFNVTNQGSLPAPRSILRFFLSFDGFLAVTDTVFQQALIAPLNPGQTQQVKLSMTLPRRVSVSGLYVIGLLDAIGAVGEMDEGNNSITFGPIP